MLKEPDQLMNMCQYLADQNEPKNEEVQEKKGEKRKRQVEVEDTLQWFFATFDFFLLSQKWRLNECICPF